MTDYTKLTKSELIKLIEESSADVVQSLRDQNLDLQRTNEELRNAEFSRKNTEDNHHAVLNKVSEELRNEKEKVKFMEGKFDELAALFEELGNSFKDQISLLGVLHRNAKTVEQLFDMKLEKYNNPGGNKQ